MTMDGKRCLVTGATNGHGLGVARALCRSLRPGAVVGSTWEVAHFPPRWHYDILRGLDPLHDAGAAPDTRAALPGQPDVLALAYTFGNAHVQRTVAQPGPPIRANFLLLQLELPCRAGIGVFQVDRDPHVVVLPGGVKLPLRPGSPKAPAEK